MVSAMGLRTTLTAGFAAALLAGCTSTASDVPPPEASESTAHWTYETGSPEGPANWGELPGDQACSGVRQSPVDLVDAVPVQRRPPDVEYRTGESEVVNNGHSVEFEPTSGGGIRDASGVEGTLANLHFHAPSEHRINGKQFPLELHFVNKTPTGATVIGLLVSEGAAAPSWDAVVAAVRQVPEPPEATTAEIPYGELLPARFQAFEYKGSLTTPPCSPIVDWVVLRRPITMSAEQISAFTDVYSDTDRPLQPLAGRRIVLTPPD